MNKVIISAILAIFGSIFGTIANPVMLSASNVFEVKRVSDAGVVETVIPEPEPEPEPEVFYAPAAGAPVEYYVVDGINIGGRTLAITDVDAITEQVGNGVYRYGKFIYGHNSVGVFGRLHDFGVGDTFTITEGGETTTYVVAMVEMFEKNQENGRLQKDGSGHYMNTVVNARGHSVSLMTCAGEALGGGRATHRLVIYADAI